MRGKFLKKPYKSPITMGLLDFYPTNTGVSDLEPFGLYYLWADSLGYSLNLLGISSGQKPFLWSDYKWTNDNGTTMTKYNDSDTLTVMLKDDYPPEISNDNYMIPEFGHFQYLNKASTDNHCTKSWVSNYNNSGISGMLYTNNSTYSEMFLPAGSIVDGVYQSSDCRYWARNISSSDLTLGCSAVIDGSNAIPSAYISRCNGLYIKPIIKYYFGYGVNSGISAAGTSTTISYSVRTGGRIEGGTNNTVTKNYVKKQFGTFASTTTKTTVYDTDIVARQYIKYVYIDKILKVYRASGRYWMLILHFQEGKFWADYIKNGVYIRHVSRNQF